MVQTVHNVGGNVTAWWDWRTRPGFAGGCKRSCRPSALQGHRVSQAYFHGYALNSVDLKNRLSIPAEFRDAIQLRSGNRDLLVGPAPGIDCLIGYDQSHANVLQARLDKSDNDEETAEGAFRSTFLFGSASPLKIDDAGRVVLTAGLKDLGDITSHVWFVAGGNWFQLWNPWRYLEQTGIDPRMFRILRREMDAKGLPLIEPAR
jgi:MraZ protein